MKQNPFWTKQRPYERETKEIITTDQCISHNSEVKKTEKSKNRNRERPGHEAVGLDAMLEAVELPAGIPHLDARLPYVDAYYLPHLSLLLSLLCSSLLQFCCLQSSESAPARARGRSQKGTEKGLQAAAR